MTAALRDDHRLAEAKGIPIEEVALRLGIEGLKRAGAELVGPCPVCGGRDRFSIAPREGVFNCRGAGGGDGIALVRHVLGFDFKAALDWLVGPPRALTPAERAAQAERAAAARRRAEEQAQVAERERAKQRQAAWHIWNEGMRAEGTLVRDYLARRGILRGLLPALPASIRFHPRLRYTVARDQGRWESIWEGPAMLAAIQGPDGKFIGVHRTWIDPARPKGKAEIRDPATGERQDAKKSLGSVMGGAIRLRGNGRGAIVMGEGIETTLSAMVSGAHHGASFWCGVSLGNMAGRMARAAARADGTVPKWSGVPDLDGGPSFVPPEGCDRLVYVEDGDSLPAMTRAKVLCGLRRAMALRPGLRGQFVSAPRGRDLNDVLMGECQAEGEA